MSPRPRSGQPGPARARLTNDSRNLHSLRSIRLPIRVEVARVHVPGHLFVVRSTVNQNGRNKNVRPLSLSLSLAALSPFVESVCRSLPPDHRSNALSVPCLFSLNCWKMRGSKAGLRRIRFVQFEDDRRRDIKIWKFGNDFELLCALVFSYFSFERRDPEFRSNLLLAKVQFYAKISRTASRENLNLGRL